MGIVFAYSTRVQKRCEPNFWNVYVSRVCNVAMDYDSWPSALKRRNSWIINKCRFCIKILVKLSESTKLPLLETLISRSSTDVITFLFKYSRINNSVTDFVPKTFKRVNVSALWNEIVLRLNVIWFESEAKISSL